MTYRIRAPDEKTAIRLARKEVNALYMPGSGGYKFRYAVQLMSEAITVPVIRMAKKMLADVSENPMRCGTSTVVDGYWIETHTLGCRNAADEPENQWWDSHGKIYDEYRNDGISVVMGDPSDGAFVTVTPQRETHAVT